MRTVLPAFTVVPRKTFLGLDKSAGHCFTMKNSLFERYVAFFSLDLMKKQQEIFFVSNDDEYPATLRFVNQNKSKPNKQGISRPWPDRHLLQIGWKGKAGTIRFLQENLQEAEKEIKSGMRVASQSVRFEHIGENKFFVSFP